MYLLLWSLKFNTLCWFHLFATGDSLKKARSRTPSGELKDHFLSAPVSRTVSVGDEGNVRQKVMNKHVCFSMSPKKKPKPFSSPSKIGVRSSKQQRASPKKKLRTPLSPLKNGERQRAKQETIGNPKDGLVSK